MRRSVTSSVNPIDVRWETSSEERERYITTLPLVMKDGENDDPHARQRARAQLGALQSMKCYLG